MLIRAFFGALDLGVGLVDRVSRLLGGEIFVSGDEISMGSSEVEDLGLGVSDFGPLKLEVLNLPWLALVFPFPEGGVGDDVLPSLAFKGEVLLLDCSVGFVGGVGEGLTALPSALTCFLGGVGEELLPSLPFALMSVFELLLFNISGCSPGSGLRVLLPASLDGDGDFFEEVLLGDTGLFGDLLFSDSRVSHNVAK